MRRQKRVPTEEELKQDKQAILESLQQGLPCRRIEANLDFSRRYILKIRKMLIEQGAITEEEIAKASAKYYKEHPNAQGLNKTKVHQPKGTERAENRHANSISTKERVFELVNQNFARVEIAEEIGISETAVVWHIKNLIEEGRIKESDVKKLKKGERTSSIDKTSEEYISTREQVASYLRLGWKNNIIRRQLGITTYLYSLYLRDIKASKILSAQEIIEARQVKYQDDLNFVEDCVKKGFSLEQIRALKPEFAYNEVTPMIRRLVDEGRITQEQVNSNAKAQRAVSLNKNALLSPENQIAFILEKIREGYSPQEIVDSDDTKILSLHKVLYQKRKLIAEGAISQEEATSAMKKHQAELLQKRHKNDIALLRNYIKLGYTQIEIKELLGCSSSYIATIKKEIEFAGEWFSREEIREFARLRKEREENEFLETLLPEEREKYLEAKSREKERLAEEKQDKENQHRQEIEERRQAKRDSIAEKHEKDLRKAKRLIKTGITMEEVAKAMHCSVAYLYQLRRKSIEAGTWLTKRELSNIKKRKSEKRMAISLEKEADKKEKSKQRIEAEEQRKLEQIWQLRNLTEKGLSLQEIAEEMHYSVPTIIIIKRRARENNLWFSKEDLKAFQQERQIREEKEAKQKEEEEKRHLDEECKRLENIVKEEEERKKEFERQRRKKISGFSSQYKILRKAAKLEDKQEITGEENVSTESRKKFFEILSELEKLQAKISEGDLRIVINALDLHPEMASKETIKFLISHANRSGGMKSAEAMSKQLMNTLRDTNFYEPLVNYSRWIKRQIQIPQMQEMLKDGISIDVVADKFLLSTAEVKILLSQEKKQIDFFEDDGDR